MPRIKINSSTLIVNGLTAIASLIYLGSEWVQSNQDTVGALIGQNHVATTMLICNLVSVVCRLYNNAGPRKPIELADPKKALATLKGEDPEDLQKPPISDDTDRKSVV